MENGRMAFDKYLKGILKHLSKFLKSLSEIIE